MKVWIAQPLRSYTSEERVVEEEGSTLGEILANLEQRFPGIRFRMIDEQDRIRQHIHIFIGQKMAHGLDEAVPVGQEVMIVAALSGG